MKVRGKITNLWMWLFQKDYWSMSDKELHDLALKYNIPPMSLPEGDTNWGQECRKIF